MFKPSKIGLFFSDVKCDIVHILFKAVDMEINMQLRSTLTHTKLVSPRHNWKA